MADRTGAPLDETIVSGNQDAKDRCLEAPTVARWKDNEGCPFEDAQLICDRDRVWNVFYVVEPGFECLDGFEEVGLE